MNRMRREAVERETVGGYVSELTRQAQRRLPPEEARAAVAEVEGHLTEQVAELEAGGMARREAEAVALTGFGKPRLLAQGLADSAYADRWTPLWRALGGALTGALLAAPVVSQILRAADPAMAAAEWGRAAAAQALGGAAAVTGLPLTPTLLTVALASVFLARRASPVRMVAVGGAAAAAMFLVAGFSMVQSVRGPLDAYTASRAFDSHPALVGHWDQELMRLDRGFRFYREAPSSVAVPGTLTFRGAYIVPLSPSETSGVSVFKPLSPGDSARLRRVAAEEA